MSFPANTIRAAIAEHGDEWVWHAPNERRPLQAMLDHEVDSMVMARADVRRGLLRRDVGYRARLPRALAV